MEIKAISRCVVLVVLAAAALSASASSAATWKYSTTSSSLTATGPATRLATVAATLACSTSGAVLTGPSAGTYTGPVSTSTWNHVAAPATAIQITIRFSACRVGATPYTVKCNADEPIPVAGAYLNATSTTARSEGLGTTSINLSAIDCNVYVGNGTTNFCTKITSTGATVSGGFDRQGVQGMYSNPAFVGATDTLRIDQLFQSLTSNTSGSGCVLGNGAVTLSDSSGGPVNYTVGPSAFIWAA